MPRVGASNIPEMEMKHDPMAQAYRRTATGLVASNASRVGESTTACIETPRRDRLKKR